MLGGNDLVFSCRNLGILISDGQTLALGKLVSRLILIFIFLGNTLKRRFAWKKGLAMVKTAFVGMCAHDVTQKK